MNKSYVIVPAALLILFVGFEQDFERRRTKLLAAQAERDALKKNLEDDSRQQQQLAARRDAEARTAERERAERERVEKKQHADDTALAALRHYAETETAAADALSTEMETLSRQLSQLRDQRTAAEQVAFELARAVEHQRVDRRNAEIEVQRTTAMVVERIEESQWANRPAAPAPGRRN